MINNYRFLLRSWHILRNHVCFLLRRSLRSRTTTWVVLGYSGPESGKSSAIILTEWDVVHDRISHFSQWIL